MPTDAQIDTVARAISPDVMQANPADWGMAEDQEQIRLIASNAVAAYEASRPAVATDEELLAVFNAASYASTTMAGIRAVRERLTLAVPEVTDAMVDAAMAAWRANGGLLYLGDPWPIRAALAAAIRDAIGEVEGADAQ